MAVPGERRAANGATAGAGGSSSLLAGSDEILGWLDVLLKGKPEQQALARTEIAMILEARGFADDAEEAYWTNVQARATDRRSYERLIALYQLRGTVSPRRWCGASSTRCSRSPIRRGRPGRLSPQP